MATEIKIYTTVYCGYCHAAKRLLSQHKLVFEDIDVTIDRKTRAWLRETTGRSTVPQIFWNGESIGGFTDLQALLPELLAQVSGPTSD